MSRKCAVTGRQTRSGNSRSHAMNANKRKWKSNVQKVRVMIDGKPQKVYVSARALKSGKIKRA
ncbi:large subunit ribosomal protein L28 [Salinibacillus kushneri]|uniref:Large ribosomal subunit protein bL28 n=1 Tax=Salinibacillus kushneri TaxID=237682 RepID=A0A1I0HLU9_9BACI|nr:50S ribosomal protein L28 [Salinibacillus kushneri]SET84141.1 large subunit ribosomal protein L28 [Salinibacillus kushneri]